MVRTNWQTLDDEEVVAKIFVLFFVQMKLQRL